MRIPAIILACLLLGISACTKPEHTDVVAVSSVMPILDLPPKPTMELLTKEEVVEYASLSAGLRAKLEKNNELLKEYAMQLKVTLETYDNFAKTHNANGSGIQVQTIPATTPATTTKGKRKWPF